MIDFTKEELEFLFDNIEDEMSTYRCKDDEFRKNLLKKIKMRIGDEIKEVPKSLCECNDLYHPYGAICLKTRF